MEDYRLYFMNRHSGHIERVEEFGAPGDAAAVTYAKRRSKAAPLEVWSGARKIYRLETVADLAPGAVAAAAPASWRPNIA